MLTVWMYNEFLNFQIAIYNSIVINFQFEFGGREISFVKYYLIIWDVNLRDSHEIKEKKTQN